MNLDSPFIFTSCQVGAEVALKKEVLLKYPEFRFAFSRPGFVTFKKTEGATPLDFRLDAVFGRCSGISFGRIEKGAWPKVIDLTLLLKQRDPTRKVVLQVWQRDEFLPGLEPPDYIPNQWVKGLESEIRSLNPEIFENAHQFPAPGDWVIHVIAVDADSYYLGLHFHSLFHPSWPGGRPEIRLPKEAPSRAYLKIEEAILRFKPPFLKLDQVMEIGSAPGGASYALLQRELRVIGVDPGNMDPKILGHSHFRHIQKPISEVERTEIPGPIQWLLLDMNTEPRFSVYAVDRWVNLKKSDLIGVILTIKLNKWKIADEIPAILEHLQSMGLSYTQALQLSFHRQEIVIYGLTRKGRTRMIKK